jgi:two-component system, cell cycle sensor histidine kinase and response regulator CckA
VSGGLNTLAWVVIGSTLAGAITLIFFLRRHLARLLRSERATGARLRAVIEASPAAIVELDELGRIRLWNRMAERMFGWRSDDVVGRPPPVVPAEHEAEHGGVLERARANGFAYSELQLERRDGRSVDVAVSASPVRDATGLVTGTMEVVTDVSDRKRLEEELRLAQRMEALGRLAGGIAHDFNNILLAIKSEAWLLGEQLGEDREERRSVESLERAADRAASLTRQLLAFSRRQVLQPRHLDLNAVVGSTEEMLRRLIGEDVEFATALEHELPAVRADPGQVEQVLINLIVNARDAMPDGGRLTLETHSLESTLGYVVLSVTDTGVGIDPADRPYIFDPFFTTKGPGHGTGLGLATVHGIVRQSGGRIEVASEPGRGATFSVYLPCAEAAPPALVFDTVSRTAANGSGTVLLVEDEALARRPLRRILEGQGYRVLEAADGVEALAVAAGHPDRIDVLLTDVVMPELGGPELAQRLLEERPAVKVVYMSGYVDRAEELLASDDAVLQKPFAPEALTSALERAIEPD